MCFDALNLAEEKGEDHGGNHKPMLIVMMMMMPMMLMMPIMTMMVMMIEWQCDLPPSQLLAAALSHSPITELFTPLLLSFLFNHILPQKSTFYAHILMLNYEALHLQE